MHVNSRPPHPRWALAAVALGAFCVQLDSFALNAALPALRRDLGASAAVSWVVGGYLLAAGALMPLAGRLADLFGRRRVLICGLALFAAACVPAALAPSLPLLVAARVAQGAGAALVMPAGLALLTRTFPGAPGRRMTGRALGLAGLATVCGPFVGGALAQHVSWRAVFWLSVPPAVAAAGCALRAADSRAPGAPGPLDAAGAVTATGTCAFLALSVERGPWWLWAAAAAASAALFVRAERRAAAPLVDLALFRNGRYVRLTAAGAVANAATVALLFVVPLALQRQGGLPPLTAGLAFLAPAAALALGGPLAARIRPAASVPAMALCLALAAFALGASEGAAAAPVALVLVSTASAAALGVAGALSLTGTQAAVRPERAGEASGVTKAALTVTAALGLPLTDASPAPSLHLPAAACLATALALTLATIRRPDGTVTLDR